MAKQGMKRPEPEHRKNEMPPVPQFNGKARSGKVFHDSSLNSNDLAVENIMDGFDMTAADAQDLRRHP